jgi:DNA repair exonuclease SbcCD ATPase subunit
VADPVEEAADRLYGLPLEDFVRERDAAAKALRAEKDRDAAKQVGALAKPSAAAWAVNAIAREQPKLRDELLAAGDALRDAQDEAVAGKGGKALRDATARQRKAIDAILTAAGELQPGGKSLGRAALDRLRQTLQAAAGDDALRTALERGRLVRDAEGGGAWPFGGGDDEPEPEPKPKPGKRTASKPRRDDRDEAQRAAREREAAERRKEIEARLGEARAERRARERELARAEREAERAAQRLDQAQEALDEARAAAEEAQSELTAAADAVAEARDHAARLEEQLD